MVHKLEPGLIEEEGTTGQGGNGEGGNGEGGKVKI